MKKNALKYIFSLLLVTSLTQVIHAQTNEYANFVQAVNDLKRTGLKRMEMVISKARIDTMPDGRRKRIPPQKAHYVSKSAVKEYIRLFDRLRCTQPEAMIQCYYLDSRMGGQPFLVASPLSVDSLAKADVLTSQWCNENDASKVMKPADDSPMAYFQHLYFQVYGEQFALYWHALYNKRTILLEHPDNTAKNTLALPFKGTVADEALNAQALTQGMHPVVTLTDEACLITLYEENHQSIAQVTFRISRQSPYIVERVKGRPMLTKPDITY